jgi:hypothetical protein
MNLQPTRAFVRAKRPRHRIRRPPDSHRRREMNETDAESEWFELSARFE